MQALRTEIQTSIMRLLRRDEARAAVTPTIHTIHTTRVTVSRWQKPHGRIQAQNTVWIIDIRLQRMLIPSPVTPILHTFTRLIPGTLTSAMTVLDMRPMTGVTSIIGENGSTVRKDGEDG